MNNLTKWLGKPAFASGDWVIGLAGVFVVTWAICFEGASYALQHSPAGARFLGDWVGALPDLAMIALAAYAAKRSQGRIRGFWAAIAVSSLFWLIGDLVWNYYEYGLHRPDPYPSWADLFYLLSYLFTFIALIAIFRVEILKTARSLLDSAVVLLAVSFVSWEYLISSHLNGAVTSSTIADISYPVLDLGEVTLFLILGLTIWRVLPRSLWLVGTAMVVGLATDLGNTYVSGLNTYRSGGLFDAGWQVQMLLIALAALVAIRGKEKLEEAEESQDAGMVPLFVAVALLVSVDAAQGVRGHLGHAVIVSAVALALVAIRLLLTTHLQGKYNDYFRVLIDSSPLGVIEIDMDGRVLLWNAAAEKMYGYPASEVLGKPHPALSTEEGKESLEDILQRVKDGEQSFSIKTTRRRKNGEVFTYSLHVSGRYDAKGQAIGVIGLGVDITESENALQELSSSRELYRLVVENSHDMIALLDSQGRFVFASPSYEFSLGYASGELENVSPVSLVHPSDVQLFSDSLRQVVISHMPNVVELRIRHKSGRWVYIEGTITAVLDDNDKLHRVLFSARDLSDRRSAEEELREAEARYRLLIEQLPMAIYICSPTDTGFRWTYLSPQVRQIAGVDPIAWTDNEDGFTEALHPEDRGRVLAERNKSKDKGSLGIEYRIITPDGEEVWVHEEGRVIRDLAGTPTGLQGYLLDVTTEHLAEEERGHLERQLIYAQKMDAIGQLAAGIAHDFNNLMMAVSGHTELAMFSFDDKEELETNLQEVQRAVSRAAGLSQQLLEFSRYQEKSTETTDLVASFKDMQRMLERIISEAIEMQVTVPNEPLVVCSDPTRLEQVILNLIVNARDAIDGTGRIDVVLDKISMDFGDGEHDCARFCVQDNGSGMSEETRLHLFEPFFTTKEVGKGTGLGLSTVYSIVTQAGGQILVDSVVGEGSTFSIYLPLADEEEKLPEASNGTKPEGGSEGRWLK